MAVIVREERVLGGERVQGVVTFKSTRLVTADAEERARRLDVVLDKRVRTIVSELDAAGLLERRGRPGVLELWWELGSRLAFIETLAVEPDEDRRFIWRALYDHGPELVPGPGRVRLERGDSHFFYCYLLGKMPWPLVESAGDWTSWVEFFDSERIRSDPRIIEWLGERSSASQPDWVRFTDRARQSWIRPLAKAIRHRFKSRDTTILTDAELRDELDAVFSKLTP
jgi:hypothetical protein